MPEPAPNGDDAARRPLTPKLLWATAAFSAAGIAAGLLFFASPTPLSFAIFTTAGEAALLLSGFLYLLVIARDIARRTRAKVAEDRPLPPGGGAP